MLGANATTRTPREPTTRPMTIHGRRMPSFDEVRSLIFPKNGLAKIDSREPVAATSAKLFGACFDPHERVDLQCQGDQQRRPAAKLLAISSG